MRTCPKCGHRFVTKNMWYSCCAYPLECHFDRCQPEVRNIFDHFRELIEACGEKQIRAWRILALLGIGVVAAVVVFNAIALLSAEITFFVQFIGSAVLARRHIKQTGRQREPVT